MRMTLKERRAKRELKKLCDELGLNMAVVDENIYRTLTVTVPDGKIFMCDEIHEMVDVCYKPWHPDYEDMLNRVRHGMLEDCPYTDCEWCNGDDE